MNRRTESSSLKILSTSIESSGRRIPIEMESLCTSMPRWVNERCETLDTGRLLSAWGSFCLRVDDPRQSGRGAGRSMMTKRLTQSLGVGALRGRSAARGVPNVGAPVPLVEVDAVYYSVPPSLVGTT